MKLIVLFTILLAWGVLAQDYDSESDYADANQDSYDAPAPIENPIEQAPELEQRPPSEDYYKEPTDNLRPDEEYRPQENESESEDANLRNTEEVPYDNYDNEEDRSYEE